VWYAQKYMFMDTLGAVAAVILFVVLRPATRRAGSV